MKTTLRANGPYDFRSVVFSHGWVDLPPYQLMKTDGCLKTVVRTSKGVHDVTVRPSPNGISIESSGPTAEITKACRWMFRLDDEMYAFYEKVNLDGKRWIAKRKMGRLLRSQTVFEDLIKLILTTNCSWAFTRIMTGRLAEELGQVTGDGMHAFPTPKDLAEKTENYYRSKIRAGYRSPHLRTIGKAIVSGQLNPEEWKTSSRSTEDLRKEILKVPGAGPYVAENLLKFLGRYDRLGLDSWARGKLKEIWKMKKIPSDKMIERRYRTHGDYRGLVLWCDLTRDWFESGEFSSWIRVEP